MRIFSVSKEPGAKKWIKEDSLPFPLPDRQTFTEFLINHITNRPEPTWLVFSEEEENCLAEMVKGFTPIGNDPAMLAVDTLVSWTIVLGNYGGKRPFCMPVPEEIIDFGSKVKYLLAIACNHPR